MRPTSDLTRATRQGDSSSDAVAAASFIEESFSLHPLRTPARRLPRMLSRLMPNPCDSIDSFSRFHLLDVRSMSWRAARHEALQLRFAIAFCDDLEDIPLWIWDRLRALDVRTNSVAA